MLRYTRLFALISILSLVGKTGVPACASASGFNFHHHFIDKSLPRDAWGQTAFADLDNDGDMDFITGRRNGEIRWYEYSSADKWIVHILGQNSPSDVGGVVLDVNRDRKLDFVAGGVWYRHPSNPKTEPWNRYIFDSKLAKVHDVVAADIDMDGKKDVITMSDKNDLRWYKIPDNPEKPWTKHVIFASIHAGIAAADLDADGDTDIVRGSIWLENKEKGTQWEVHEFCGVPWADRKDYTGAAKAVIADIDANGRVDIILTEAEFAGARIAWFESPNDPTQVPWKEHFLPNMKQEKRGPFHSLQVADFDNDGDQDIFSGEMEWLGKPPYRWFIWENVSGDGSRFIEHVILDSKLGTHEAVAGDVDGDGDIDLAGKLWRPVPNNGNDGKNHADYLENLLIQK